ncbi:Hypothetical protein PHPALM_38007, partial [Phytophthora palmivora]
MSEAAGDAMKLRLKLKLPRSMSVSSVAEEAQKKLLIGARGGAAVKELLSTAPNIEVAIRDFQAAHGVAEAHAQLFVRKKESKRKETPTTFTPAVQLLDLLQMPRSSIYQSLLDQMKKEMLLRIADLPQNELPRVLEQTFPYIEFRELRAIPIAVLARQEDTPELYLRELTENRRILSELPVHIWRSYVVAANIPGSATNNHPKEYVDYVSLLGAMRSDLANLQRDKTTPLLRTDPLHKFIWFLDRALKNQTLEIAQLHELLGFIGRLRTSDLPPNKKFRKKGGAEEEEESFEVVLGPPPVDELLTVLDKIAKIDARLIFAEPVPDDVPKYRDIIKDPMDLSTMRRKAKRGKYKTLDAFVADFNLMIRNCMTFNPDTTIFYKEGKRIGKRGNELIERNAAALRGEPQRIRTKKRRKTGTGPTSEALSMLTSSGVVTIKDFGDVDQSGMIPEGMCDELLADVALVLSDPPVKQLICDALMKSLVVCWQKKELPTDNLICRALVQLLQIGNPSSVRRMIRKQDFVLRAPQSDFKTKAKEDVLGAMLWDNVLRASSAIRAMAKSFAVQCLVDHQIDAAEVVLEQVKLAAVTTNTSNGSDGGSSSAENGEVTMTLILAKRIQTAKEVNGSVVHFADGAIEVAEDEHNQQLLVKSFPIPVFHEKTVMLLSSLAAMVEKGGPVAGSNAMITSYLKKTLGVLRTSCSSLKEFEALWNSPVFAGCRQFYEPLLTKCPVMHKELFTVLASDVKTEDVQKKK